MFQPIPPGQAGFRLRASPKPIRLPSFVSLKKAMRFKPPWPAKASHFSKCHACCGRALDRGLLEEQPFRSRLSGADLSPRRSTWSDGHVACEGSERLAV